MVERLALSPAAVHALVMASDALFVSMGQHPDLCATSVQAARIGFLTAAIAQLNPTDDHVSQGVD